MLRSIFRIAGFLALSSVFHCLPADAETLVLNSQSSSIVWSSPLAAGQTYMIEVQGDYGVNGPGPRVDAEWIQTVRGSWSDPIEDYPYDPARMHELLVNGQDFCWQGTTDGTNFASHVFSPSHVYQLPMLGTGDPVSFQILDTAYYDNTGSLTVSIEQEDCPNPVQNLTIAHSDPLPYAIGGLAAALQDAVTKFEKLVKDAKGTFHPTSGYRTREYQAHLREVAEKFKELAEVPTIVAEAGNPWQLKVPVDGSASLCALADSKVVTTVNAEMGAHNLPTTSTYLGVESAGTSMHVKKLAVDITIALPADSEYTVDGLAAEAGLQRTHAKERWHFELLAPQFQGGITAECPIDILVEDPSGRRIGFDPTTGEVVNDFGESAEYSGPGSEPQTIFLSLGDIIPGDYTITGMGTGEGTYSISLQIAGADNSLLMDQVIATGIASMGVPIDSVGAQLYPVPEPSSLVLVGVGLLALLMRRHQRCSRP